MPTQPNILFIFTDQQRFDTIHALGNTIIQTPNLDRLVNEGTAFTSAYSPSPVCVPARCSVIYGQYPASTGCYDNGFPYPDDGRPTFMQSLRDAGYRTHGVGKCHFPSRAGEDWGFDSRDMQEELARIENDDYLQHLIAEGYEHVIDPHGVRGEMYYIPQVSQLPERWHPCRWVADRSLDFIASASEGDKPWYCYTSFIHPHPPFAPPSPWHKLYRAPLMPLPHEPIDYESLQVHINRVQNRYKYRDQGFDRNLQRNIVAHYYACISYIDYQIGRLLDDLQQRGILDETLIIFSSDHGELLGDYGCYGKRSMHDAAARVPMLARLPGRYAAGARCEVPVNLVDIGPSMLAAASAEALSCDGQDMAAIAAGDCEREAVFSQFNNAESGLYSVVTEQWKYVYSAADEREFLFDRVHDPRETRNRAGLRPCRAELQSMRQLLLRQLQQAGKTDVLTEGKDGLAWQRYAKQQVPIDPDANLLFQDPPVWQGIDIPGYHFPRV